MLTQNRPEVRPERVVLDAQRILTWGANCSARHLSGPLDNGLQPPVPRLTPKSERHYSRLGQAHRHRPRAIGSPDSDIVIPRNPHVFRTDKCKR